MSRTYDEIQNQPRAWEATIPAAREQWRGIVPTLALGPDTHFMFVGSGTSLYIAQSAAHAFQEVTGRVATAVPASEVFLSAASTVPKHVPVIAFLISRSGTTSEGVIAAEFLARAFDRVRTVGLTCNLDTALAAKTDHVIELPHASERSVVMTQSFTSMLLALQVIAAEIADDDRLRGELVRLPELLRAHVAACEAFGQELSERADLERFVFLGLGPNLGLAEEGRLKLKEMTQLSCAAYNPLEFRHGPISTLAADTAVLLLAGERERAYVADVERDLKRAGAFLATIGPYPSDHADRALALADGLSDLGRGVLYLPPLQFLGYYRAVALGLDPDAPRNLNQVVTIRAR